MNFFQNLFYPNKPWLFKKQIKDSFFGLMWFNKKSLKRESHYQCQIIFSHTNKPLDIFIDAQKDGIKSSQKALFFEFEKRYYEILNTIKTPLEKKIKKRKLIEEVTIDMKTDFHIWSLAIHSQRDKNQFSIGISINKYNIPNLRLNISDFKFKEFLN